MPIPERFDKARQRPRKEMKTEIDQAHFLIGAAMPGSGVNLEEELGRDTWMVRRSVEAVLDWYAKTAVEPEVKKAAALAGNLLRMSLEQNRAKLRRSRASCSTTYTRMIDLRAQNDKHRRRPVGRVSRLSMPTA